MRIEYIHVVTAQYSSNSVHFKQQGRFRRSCHVAVSDTYNSERSTFAGLFRFRRRLVLRKWTSAGVGMFLSPTLDQKNDQQNHSNHDQGTNNRRNDVSWVSSGAQQANQTRSMLTAWLALVVLATCTVRVPAFSLYLVPDTRKGIFHRSVAS